MLRKIPKPIKIFQIKFFGLFKIYTHNSCTCYISRCAYFLQGEANENCYYVMFQDLKIKKQLSQLLHDYY